MAEGDKVVKNEQGEEGGQEFFLHTLSSRFVPGKIRRKVLCEMVSEFPEPTKNRVRALRQLQYAATKLEVEFYNDMYKLECQYHDKYMELYQKRAEIVSGVREPNPEEEYFTLGNVPVEGVDVDSKFYDSIKKKMIVCKPHLQTKNNGIPEFWLQIFRNVSLLNDMVEEEDEPVLRSLRDITVKYQENPPMGFILEFHFHKNDYFTNQVLTKEYIMKCDADKVDPFSFEGPEIVECKGCTIDWKPAKNLTVRSTRDSTNSTNGQGDHQEERSESFFNFFAPPALPVEGEDDYEEILHQLTTDYEVAHYLRERIIPRAILYFTGEAGDSDDSDDEDDDDEIFEEEEEEEESSPAVNGHNE